MRALWVWGHVRQALKFVNLEELRAFLVDRLDALAAIDAIGAEFDLTFVEASELVGERRAFAASTDGDWRDLLDAWRTWTRVRGRP